jgi:hypothetical protein
MDDVDIPPTMASSRRSSLSMVDGVSKSKMGWNEELFVFLLNVSSDKVAAAVENDLVLAEE